MSGGQEGFVRVTFHKRTWGGKKRWKGSDWSGQEGENGFEWTTIAGVREERRVLPYSRVQREVKRGRHKAHEHSASLMASGRLPAVRDSTAISPVRLLRVPEAVVASGSAIWNSKHYLLFDDVLWDYFVWWSVRTAPLREECDWIDLRLH